MEEKENREQVKRCPVCSSAVWAFCYDKLDQKLETKDRYVKCRTCGAFFIENRLNPQFIIQKFYKDRNNIGSIEKYLKKKFYLEKVVKKIKRFLPKKSVVFDIGCGGGALLKFMKDHGYNVFGLEVSEEAKEEAETVIGLKNIICCGDFLKLDFNENFFDAVLMTDVVEHLHNPHVYLEKITKILKPRGLLVIRTPNSDCFFHKLVKQRWMLSSPRHIVIYNRNSLLALLEKNKFKAVYFSREKYTQTNLFPSFSQGFNNFLRGFAVNFLRKLFALIGKGESITIIARKNF